MNRLFLKFALLLCWVIFVGSLSHVDANIQATLFIVNGKGDRPDINPGDGVCDTVLTIPGEQCGLRAAIEEANALGNSATPYHIDFDISGSGPFVISPDSKLPEIEVPVIIDGTSQDNSICATANAPASLQIILDGSNAGSSSGLALKEGSDSSVIKGLEIVNFSGNGITVISDNNRFECNHIGFEARSSAEKGNNNGISLSGEGNIIGGSDSIATRNVISGNEVSGIEIFGEQNKVLNNYIGSTEDGNEDLGNGYGVLIFGNNNEIGDGSSDGRNIIVGSRKLGEFRGDGIQINSGAAALNGGDSNKIFGNYIGIGADGETAIPNSRFGVGLFGSVDSNKIGSRSQPNVIAKNSDHGISVQEFLGGFPTRNEVFGNSIFENGGIGLEIGNTVQTVALPDLDNSSTSGWLTVSINDLPGRPLIIDLFRNDACDASGSGEGRTFIGRVNITANGNGLGEAEFELPNDLKTGEVITALANQDHSQRRSQTFTKNRPKLAEANMANTEPNPSQFSECFEPVLPAQTETPTPTSTGTPSETPTDSPPQTLTPTISQTPTGTITPEVTLSATPTATMAGTPQNPAGSDDFIYLPLIQNK